MTVIRKTAQVGDKTITIETGRVAKQAGGAVLISCGESVVLVAATGSKDARPGTDFLPLTCEYRPMSAAAGMIPGGYFKREGRPGPKATLVARMMDRPLRPLFPKAWRAEIQLLAYPMSHDQENATDVLALTGASTATVISDLPFDGPVAGIRVGRVDGQWVANPTKSELKKSDFNMVIACTRDAITMVEGGMAEASEADVVAGLEFGFKAGQALIDLQLELQKECGKPKRDVPPAADLSALAAKVADAGKARILQTFGIVGKHERHDAMDAVKAALVDDLGGDDDALRGQVAGCVDKLIKSVMRQRVITDRLRLDGRAPETIRALAIEVGVLPRTHGSALFTRGETQAIVTCTLGTKRDEQRIDELDEQGWERFMLHYNFPPYSVGECRRLGGAGRREIGHGALAERAVRGMLPTVGYPYVVRVVSDITESNGSSSMASVCGASLAMADAGVPIKAHVAGVAMGLIKEGDAFAVLTDISGDEDHLGDMDFKVTGTRAGMTAFQMDTKIKGVSSEIMTKALLQAKDARNILLDAMEQVLPEPRKELSRYAPRIEQIKIPVDRIRDIIGPGGKTIKGIQEQTGAELNVDDDGTVTIASANGDSLAAAVRIVRELSQEAEVGKLYLGVVKKVVDFGAFVEIFTGTDGLVHISELAPGRVDKVTDVVQEGDEVLVKCIEVDKSGKIRLSRKAALGESLSG